MIPASAIEALAAALELAEIVTNIQNDAELSSDEKAELIDALMKDERTNDEETLS